MECRGTGPLRQEIPLDLQLADLLVKPGIFWLNLPQSAVVFIALFWLPRHARPRRHGFYRDRRSGGSRLSPAWRDDGITGHQRDFFLKALATFQAPKATAPTATAGTATTATAGMAIAPPPIAGPAPPKPPKPAPAAAPAAPAATSSFPICFSGPLVPWRAAASPFKRNDFRLPADSEGVGGVNLGALGQRMRDRWRTVSSLSEPNTSVHSSKGRLLVTRIEPRL